MCVQNGGGQFLSSITRPLACWGRTHVLFWGGDKVFLISLHISHPDASLGGETPAEKTFPIEGAGGGKTNEPVCVGALPSGLFHFLPVLQRNTGPPEEDGWLRTSPDLSPLNTTVHYRAFVSLAAARY